MINDSDRPDDRPDDAHAAVSPVPPPTSSSSTKALIGLLLAGTIGMVIFLFVNISKDGKIRPGSTSAHAECTRGQDCLPDVNYVDTTGVNYSHASLAGKVVVVNFWATWCRPCQAEIPALSRAYDKYKAKGVTFFGVLVDTPENAELLNFQSDHEMTYPVVRVTSDLMSSYHYPQSLPTTFVYDRHGKQVFSRVGALQDSDIDSLLGQLVAQN
jgi:thiol-disulfide isomerase/thioredoxin